MNIFPRSRPNRRCRLTGKLAIVQLVVFIPVAALAQPAAEPRPSAAQASQRVLLDEIIVSDERRESPTSRSVEEMRKHMRRIPGAVDLIGQEAFDQRYAEHIGEMLRSTPGVFAQERYSEEIRLSIRGSGLSLNFHNRGIELLIDGVPVNFADGFGDFQEIDARMIRHVEVYKGGNGFEFGAATLGGAINFVSPTGRTAKAENDFALDGGSFATARFTGSVARAHETYDFFISGSAVHADHFRDHSEQNNGRININAGFRLGERTETRFYIIANHINQEIPGSLSLHDALNSRRDAAPVNISNDWQRNIRSLRLINKTSVILDQDGRLDIGAWTTLRDLDHPIFVFIDDAITDYGLFARYSRGRTVMGLRHDLTAGLTARRSENDDDWFVNEGGKRGFQIRDTRQTASQIQGYLRDQIRLGGGFAFDIALQAFATRRKFRDAIEPVNDDVEKYQAINPKAGFLWDVNKRTQIWANISRAVEPPSFVELVQRPILRFVALEKQDSWTAELGTRGTWGALGWNVTFFRSWIDNEFLQFTVDPDVPANTFNADDTIHQGIEAAFDITLARDLWAAGDRLLLASNYTLSDFYFDDDRQFGDNTLPIVPRHVYHGELRYERDQQFHIAMTLDWAPKAPWVDFANTLRATDYAVLGIDASVSIAGKWTLFADIQNLTDARYVSNFSTLADASAPETDLRVFTPGDGFAIFTGIRARF